MTWASRLFWLAILVWAIPATAQDDPNGRARWFWEQRTFPTGQIPAGARLAAVQQLDRLRTEARGKAQQDRRIAALSSASWTFIGPQPINFQGITYASGSVTGLAVNPSNTQIMYLAASEGGIWKTIDGGVHWASVNDQLPSMAMSVVTIDPVNPNIVYAGTGDPEAAHGQTFFSGVGLLKSTDGGNTWATLTGPGKLFVGGRILSLVVNPNNDQVLLMGFLGSTSGIYRSIDGGATWTLALAGTPAPSGLAVFSSGLVYSAMQPKQGIYRSQDGGVTWTAANGSGSTGLPLSSASTSGLGFDIGMGVAPSNSSILYVSLVKPGESFLGMYKSQDGGGTWTQLPLTTDYCSGGPPFTPYCWHSNFVTVHPSNPNVVFAGGVGMQHSIDGGQTWSDALVNPDNGNINVHSDQQVMTWTSGGQLYVGNDGGVYMSNNAANASVNWTNLNGTLGLTQFYPGFAIHPTNPSLMFAGAQDNAVSKYTGSTSWSYVSGGDGGWAAFDFTAPSTIYAELQTLSGVNKSTDGGVTWNAANTGIGVGTDSQIFVPPLVMDPGNSQRLYYGTTYIYQTTNGAANWQRISTNFNDTFTCIAVSPLDSNTIFAATSGGHIKLSTNATSSAPAWTDVTGNLPSRYITQVVADANNTATAYATVSGFGTGHVFQTINHGTSWTDISGNLPNIPVNDLVVDPDVPGTFYAATDVGVFFTSNSGVSWFVMGTNFPYVSVQGLKLHRPSRILRAGTYGRGMWDVQVPITGTNPIPSLTSLAPAIVAPGSTGATLTINGSNFTAASNVQWNGVNRAATFVSGSQLTVALTSTDLAVSGSATVAVYTPLPGGGLSNALTLIINSSYPAPQALSVAPPFAAPGSPNVTVTVTGSNFVPASVVRWNGSARPTTVVSGTTLTATIFAADLATAGQGSITVFTPAPGGGVSATINFRVGSSQMTLASVSGAEGITLDPLGNVYATNSTKDQIQAITPSGSISNFAGTGAAGSSGDGGLATAATFNYPTGLAFDSAGNLYVADTRSQRVRRIAPNGVIKTVAGTGNAGSSGDGGPATSALLLYPDGVAVDNAGNLYISEECRVRKVALNGIISTFAGSACGFSGDGGPATAAKLNGPFQLAFDNNGSLYIAEDSNQRVRRVTADGNINTIAGGGTTPAASGVLATSAAFGLTDSVAVDSAGNVFVGTIGGVYEFTVGGALTQLISDSSVRPMGLFVDQTGTLYIADSSGGRVITLQSAGAAASAVPTVPQGGIVNGASFSKDGVVAPWSLVSLFGSGLATSTGGAAALPLPLGIGGTEVFVGTTLAPLVYVSTGQINFQVPVEATGSSASVTVAVNGVHAPAVNMTLASVSPGIFVANGSGQGAILNQDYSANSTANPAAAGSVIQIFATGLGATNPPVEDGQPANGASPFNVTATPVVLINGASATVQFSAGAPGFVGLYQVNVTVPAGTPSGNATLQIQMGGRSSNTVTFAVK